MTRPRVTSLRTYTSPVKKRVITEVMAKIAGIRRVAMSRKKAAAVANEDHLIAPTRPRQCSEHNHVALKPPGGRVAYVLSSGQTKKNDNLVPDKSYLLVRSIIHLVYVTE